MVLGSCILASSLATKVIVNQLVFTTPLNIYFFGMQSILSDGGISEALDRITELCPLVLSIPVSFGRP